MRGAKVAIFAAGTAGCLFLSAARTGAVDVSDFFSGVGVGFRASCCLCPGLLGPPGSDIVYPSTTYSSCDSGVVMPVSIMTAKKTQHSSNAVFFRLLGTPVAAGCCAGVALLGTAAAISDVLADNGEHHRQPNSQWRGVAGCAQLLSHVVDNGCGLLVSSRLFLQQRCCAAAAWGGHDDDGCCCWYRPSNLPIARTEVDAGDGPHL